MVEEKVAIFKVVFIRDRTTTIFVYLPNRVRPQATISTPLFSVMNAWVINRSIHIKKQGMSPLLTNDETIRQ